MSARLLVMGAGLLTALNPVLQNILSMWFLLMLAGLFTVIWLMPRHLVAVTAALTTALICLIRSLLP